MSCRPGLVALFGWLLIAATGVAVAPESGAQPGPPTVARVSPRTGSNQGGTWVTITGTHFGGHATALFGRVYARHVVVMSPTEMRVLTPARKVGTTHVRVVNVSGWSPKVAADQFTYGKPPTISELDPANGLSTAARRVTITGTAFGPHPRVMFGAVPISDVTRNSRTSLTVTAPAHDAPGPVDVRVRTAYGHSATDVRSAAAARYYYFAPAHPLVWSEVNTFHPQQGGLQSLSCPTADFCAAADPYGGVATGDGVNWGAVIDTGAGGTSAHSLSCASDTFCVLVGALGAASIYDGESWSGPTSDGLHTSSWASVSCASATACVAVDRQGQYSRYNGATWTVFVTSNDQAFVSPPALSCPTSTSCFSLDPSGRVRALAGDEVSTARLVLTRGGGDLSCPTTTFCVALGGFSAQVSRYGGVAWTKPVTLGNARRHTTLGHVSCTSKTHCVAAGARSVVWDGSAWSAPTPVPAPGYSGPLACVSAVTCIGLTSNGSRTVTDA